MKFLCRQSFSDQSIYFLINLDWCKTAPYQPVQSSSGNYIIIQVCMNKFLQHMLSEINKGYPSVSHIIKPLIIIIIIGVMEIQNVFTNQDEFCDPVCHQYICNIPLQVHDIVVQAIIPFTNQLDDAKSKVIICIKDFYIKCCRPYLIPLRMYEMVINGMCKFKFAVIPVIKGTSFVFRCNI